MLTLLGCIVPDMKDIRYSIMVEYCVANAKHYCRLKDAERVLYWSQLASDYLIKRLELCSRKRV
jgi:hypothetical protein